MTDEHVRRLPRISMTKGWEIACDQCGVVAFVATQVEAKKEATEHRDSHRG